MVRDSWDLVPRKHDGAIDNGKQGAFTVNSKVELDNSFLLLQVKSLSLSIGLCGPIYK